MDSPEQMLITTPLFCKHALKSSLECEIGNAVEQFREKNNNVKPTCHKIYQGRYYLIIFSFYYLFYLLFGQRPVNITRQTICCTCIRLGTYFNQLVGSGTLKSYGTYECFSFLRYL